MAKSKFTFSSEGEKINNEDLIESGRMSEDYFETHNDPGQLQVSEETGKWILKNKKYLNLIKNEGKVIGYSFFLPANKEVMNDFVSGRINEAMLFERIKELKFKGCPEAIYLCAAVVKKEFRGKGLASEASVKIINNIIGNSDKKPVLFYWGYSKEGDKLLEKVSKITRLVLKKRAYSERHESFPK